MIIRKLTNRKRSGFTLIEILVVIALIAILAGIAFVAINPQKNFADARNTQRSNDISQMLNGLTQYLTTEGNTMATLEAAAGTISTCTTFTNIGTGANLINLTPVLVDQYLGSIPADPSGGTAADTAYEICKSANGRLTIRAENAENGKTIQLTR